MPEIRFQPILSSFFNNVLYTSIQGAGLNGIKLKRVSIYKKTISTVNAHIVGLHIFPKGVWGIAGQTNMEYQTSVGEFQTT